MPRPPEAPRWQVGWDVGGAHVKACLTRDGVVHDVAQWACPLWLGLQQLDAALAQARARWPQAELPQARHAATMTGEMVDLFADREQGVARLAAHLAEALGPSLRLYAGADGWLDPPQARRGWAAVASANWHASARLLAGRVDAGLLVDVGSTTTDLVALRGGRVAAAGRDDAERLATGELVYQGVVRTPLCALAPRVEVDGRDVNVMNELFATTADVYRLTGELADEHDQHPAADGGAKDAASTRQRLARMVGRDARAHPPAVWLALAGRWREAQLREIGGQLARVVAAAGLPADAPLIGAGCGAFLAAALAARSGRPYRRFVECVPASAADAGLARWIDVCAPAVAVALLADEGG